MSEPKKETVRIVLPPRREGQPATSTPRETAMINLPPKPVPAAPGAPVPPSVPSAPPPPAGLQPPSAPAVPKPPSFPGAPTPPSFPGAPKPPSVPGSAPAAPAVPPSAPGVPKPASVPPTVVKAPASPTVPLKAPPAAVPVPAPVTPAAKKETAKINPASGIAAKPQATVRLQPRPQPVSAASAAFKVKSAEIVPADKAVEEEIPMNLAIVTLVAALAAFALQLWIMTV